MLKMIKLIIRHTHFSVVVEKRNGDVTDKCQLGFSSYKMIAKVEVMVDMKLLLVLYVVNEFTEKWKFSLKKKKVKYIDGLQCHLIFLCLIPWFKVQKKSKKQTPLSCMNARFFFWNVTIWVEFKYSVKICGPSVSWGVGVCVLPLN